MKIISITLLIILVIYKANSDDEQQCTLQKRSECEEGIAGKENHKSEKYLKETNVYHNQIRVAVASYKPCVEDGKDDVNCTCHSAVIEQDLQPFQKSGITRQMFVNSAKYGTRYKIYNHRLYRDTDCMFPARCGGIEHFLLSLISELPNMDLVINTRDWPQLRSTSTPKAVVFSFSKTSDYNDIVYPAWTFWEGGPAISLYPTGIGRWDLQRETISKTIQNLPWDEKLPQGFFRGSRTSDERDSLVLLSRRIPVLVDAQYTKNQAWKSLKDTLNAEPAKEVSFEEHCKYKYLFNFRGVAASFRLKHLFLCKSLVFHVGDEWNEFFYFAMKPWVHYVPLEKYPSEEELENILLFFQQHDALAKEIAERGYKFIWQHLRMQDVACYWKKLLMSYQKLIKYNVEVNKELIEIKSKKIKSK